MKTDNIKESGENTQSSQKKAVPNSSATVSSNKSDGKKDVPTDSSNKGKGPKGENL